MFELFLVNHWETICDKYGWEFELTKRQNIYPDFNINVGNGKYIAIYVKTTYRKNEKIKFTLGSYTSFIRDNVKNIQHNYKDYIAHYVIGFVYDRNQNAIDGRRYNFNDEINCPYKNVEWFIQEKYKISSDKPGSGNTENIGSIESKNISDFKKGNGLFSKYGNKAMIIFDDYWKHYPKHREYPKKYTNLETYEKIKNTIVAFENKLNKK